MITIRTMKQIATSKTIPSFRSGGFNSLGSGAMVDQSRIKVGHQKMIEQERHRQWRNQAWFRLQSRPSVQRRSLPPNNVPS